jgi:hypothetical protein
MQLEGREKVNAPGLQFVEEQRPKKGENDSLY